jgi:hypothetical protein
MSIKSQRHWLGFLLVFFTQLAWSDNNNVQTFGNYEVHYSVFNTGFLSPEIAQAYNIVRSKSKALMNIAVLEKQANGTLKNVTALVTGNQYDLIRTVPLAFNEVREEHAIYYLSSFDFQNKTTLYFTLMIQPDPNKPAYKLQFNKMLYTDE